MNNPQSFFCGLLYSLAPQQLAQLHISEDACGDEFDWNESENQYEGESLASDVLKFIKELTAE
jgi:hypothetical protein